MGNSQACKTTDPTPSLFSLQSFSLLFSSLLSLLFLCAGRRRESADPTVRWKIHVDEVKKFVRNNDGIEIKEFL